MIKYDKNTQLPHWTVVKHASMSLFTKDEWQANNSYPMASELHYYICVCRRELRHVFFEHLLQHETEETNGLRDNTKMHSVNTVDRESEIKKTNSKFSLRWYQISTVCLPHFHQAQPRPPLVPKFPVPNIADHPRGYTLFGWQFMGGRKSIQLLFSMRRERTWTFMYSDDETLLRHEDVWLGITYNSWMGGGLHHTTFQFINDHSVEKKLKLYWIMIFHSYTKSTKNGTYRSSCYLNV